MSIIGKTEKRGKHLPMEKVVNPIRIVSAVKNTTHLTVTFNQPVVVRGLPNWTTSVEGPTVVSVTSPSPAVVVATFSATIAAATTMSVEPTDPAVRSMSGGYVADTMFPVS